MVHGYKCNPKLLAKSFVYERRCGIPLAWTPQYWYWNINAWQLALAGSTYKCDCGQMTADDLAFVGPQSHVYLDRANLCHLFDMIAASVLLAGICMSPNARASLLYDKDTGMKGRKLQHLVSRFTITSLCMDSNMCDGSVNFFFYRELLYTKEEIIEYKRFAQKMCFFSSFAGSLKQKMTRG